MRVKKKKRKREREIERDREKCNGKKNREKEKSTLFLFVAFRVEQVASLTDNVILPIFIRDSALASLFLQEIAEATIVQSLTEKGISKERSKRQNRSNDASPPNARL